MDTLSPFRISLPSVIEDFKKHIDRSNNKRILFSAKFGAGKSTFLDKYFTEHENGFIVLKLYPVNYSVASNEDVFELIKYDLFSELLAKYADKLDMDSEDYSTLLVAQSYLLHDIKAYPFIKALLKAAVPNGEAVVEVVDAAKDIYKGFKEYQEKIQKKEVDVIDDYIQWCEKRKGSIYEHDEITSLISDLIARVKQKLEHKPVILIIDDLDRLDPEHVFRLFNVFSAHYDAITDVNKFGLDKVIFVCDYHNIELMYKHRYGEGVDFEGYINKFYSTNIFNFDTTRNLLESIEELLLKKPSDANLKRFKRYSIFDRNNYIVKGIILLFGDLIRSKLITFRSLDQFKYYSIPDYEVIIDGQTFNASQFYFVTFINIVSQSISLNTLEYALIELSNVTSSYTTTEYSSNNQAPYTWLLDTSLSLFLTGKQNMGYSNNQTASVTIDGETYNLSMQYSHDTGLVTPSLNISAETKYNVYKFFAAAIKVGKRNNMFR
jgi:hypothetical protein